MVFAVNPDSFLGILVFCNATKDQAQVTIDGVGLIMAPPQPVQDPLLVLSRFPVLNESTFKCENVNDRFNV